MKLNGIYKVKHDRKGYFTMRVLKEDETWVKGVIVEGRADAMLDYNIKGEGEKITVKKSLAIFTEVEV